jgi:hypothetical protein
LGSSTQLWHTQLRQLFADDLLVFVSIAVGELGTPGRGHTQATAAQRNVRSNSSLKAHLGDVAGRKRASLVCSSKSAAQWHHNQRFRLIKDGHLPQERGQKT